MKVFQESDIIELLDGYLPGEWVVIEDADFNLLAEGQVQFTEADDQPHETTIDVVVQAGSSHRF